MKKQKQKQKTPTAAEIAFATLAREACDLARVAIAEFSRVSTDTSLGQQGIFSAVYLAQFARELEMRGLAPSRMAPSHQKTIHVGRDRHIRETYDARTGSHIMVVGFSKDAVCGRKGPTHVYPLKRRTKIQRRN